MFIPRTLTLLSIVLLGFSSAAAFGQAAGNPTPGADTPAAALTKLFNQAMTSFQGGDYNTAASDLEGVIAKAGPGSQLEPVYFTLGAAYFDLGQYPKAIDTLKKFLDKYPKSPRIPDATFSIGQAALQDKEWTVAADAFSQVENIPAYREHALLYEATADKELDRGDAADAALEKLISPEINSTIAESGAMMLAGLYADQKQPEKAEALMTKIFDKVSMVDNMVRLNSMAAAMGDRFLGEKDDAAALGAYRKIRTPAEVIQFQSDRVTAIQKQVQDNVAGMRANPAQAMQYIAANNLLQGELAKAKASLDQATKLPDFTPGLLLRIGRAFYDWDKKWESIVAFKRLLEKYPQAKERESALYAMLTVYAEVNQAQRSQELCEDYLKEFPDGKNAETVGYLLGTSALQADDPKGAETYFGRMLSSQPGSTFREQMRFLLGTAKFNQGKYDEAIQVYQQYLTEFPSGRFTEECNYRIAVSLVYAGKYEDAMGKLNQYLQQYPHGTFASDAKYRLMVCKYAASEYDQVIADAAAWQKEFPKDDMKGEVLSLLGDSLEAENKIDEAVPVYVESYKSATTDEVMNYSLFEAAKDMQKLGKWDDITQLFEDFVKAKPTNPSVVEAMSWISKALSHEGKTEEAKEFLVDQLRVYIGDPKREAVELLLQQLVQLCSKRPRPPINAVAAATSAATPAAAAAAAPGGSPAPSTTPVPTPVPYYAVAELRKQIVPLEENANATTQARLIYARAEMAATHRQAAVHDRLIGQIASQFKPEDLSPLLLAQAGDYVLTQGSSDAASKFYTELKEYYPESVYLDFAYVGLGEIAFAKKDYGTSLNLFTEAADKIAGSKEKEATIGKAKTLLELGSYDEARSLFEEVASMREWRGESTAYAVYELGDIQARQGHWAEAIAYYQRVFVLYQRYLPWVAKAYIGSAQSFDKLGKRPEAIGHLQEMLRNDKLQALPEIKQAKEMLQQWGVSA
jgi:TolA-binding protein